MVVMSLPVPCPQKVVKKLEQQLLRDVFVALGKTCSVSEREDELHWEFIPLVLE